MKNIFKDEHEIINFLSQLTDEELINIIQRCHRVLDLRKSEGKNLSKSPDTRVKR